MITPPSSNPTKPTNQSEVSLNESSLGAFPSAYGDFSTPSGSNSKFGSINHKSSWESGIGSELSRGVIGGQSGGHSRSNQERSMSFDHGLLKVQEFKPSLDLADESRDSSLSGSRDRIPNPIGQSRPVSKWGMDIPKQSPSNVNWGTSLEQNRVQNGLSGLSTTGSTNGVTGSSVTSSPAPSSGQLTVDLGAIGEKSSKSSIFGLENIFNMGSKSSTNSFIPPTHSDPVTSLANHDPLFPSRDLYSRDVGLTPSKASSHPPIGHQSVTNQHADTWATPTHNHHEIRRDSINHEPPLAGLPAEFKKRVESVFQSDFEGKIMIFSGCPVRLTVRTFLKYYFNRKKAKLIAQQVLKLRKKEMENIWPFLECMILIIMIVTWAENQKLLKKEHQRYQCINQLVQKQRQVFLLGMRF